MTNTAAPVIVTPEGFLAHWQGHRRLTRRVIEAFPEDRLFTFTAAPPMRPFGAMAVEIHKVSELTLDGMLTGRWHQPDWANLPMPSNKAELLADWDALTQRLDAEFSKVDLAYFTQTHKLPWGEMSGWDTTIYCLDNQVHHQGQGYVYLRELGVKPPDFFSRP